MPPDPDFDTEVTYTPEQRRQMTQRAREAARREFENDPNRTDPEATQDRMDNAVHELRIRMGLEKRGSRRAR